MHRRSFLETSIAGIGAVMIAGCSGDGDSDDDDADGAEQPDDGNESGDGGADNEETDGETDDGEPIEDDGGDGETDGGDGETDGGDQSGDEGDGDGSEFVDEVDGQVSLPYGETARVSNGVETTVSAGTTYDQMGESEPEERDRFLVVPVEAANTSDEPRTIPDQTDSWEVLFGDQQVGNVFNTAALDAEGYQAFEGGEVQGGVRREGVLLFEIDEGYDAEAVDVLWQDSFWVAGDLDGEIDVRWSGDA